MSDMGSRQRQAAGNGYETARNEEKRGKASHAAYARFARQAACTRSKVKVCAVREAAAKVVHAVAKCAVVGACKVHETMVEPSAYANRATSRETNALSASRLPRIFRSSGVVGDRSRTYPTASVRPVRNGRHTPRRYTARG